MLLALSHCDSQKKSFVAILPSLVFVRESVVFVHVRNY